MTRWVRRYKNRRDEGFSLIEVVIAAVILGFVSLALLNGLNTVNLTSRKQHIPTQEYANLATAQVLIQRTAFTACSTNANPYSALTSQLAALSVTIASIKGIPANDTTKWDTCGATWPVDGSGNQTDAPTVLQQITLQASIGRQSTRTVFKASNGTYPVGTDGTTVFSVGASVAGTATNVLNIPSGCSPIKCIGTAALAAAAFPTGTSSANMIYFVMGSNPADVTSSVSGTNVSLTEYAGGGTPWVLVGAFDKTTNTLARPIRIYENLISVPTVTTTYPAATPTYFTAITGVGFFPTTQTPTASATLPAGYTVPVYSTTSTVFSVNASTGVITIPTPANLTSTGTISVPIAASCCSFTDPNAKGNYNVSVKVTAKPVYGSTTVAAACTTSSFKTTPCVVTTTITGGSGVAGAFTATAATNNIKVNSSSSTLSGSTYTVTTTIAYNNNMCKTGAANQAVAIGDLSFTDSGTTYSITNSAALPSIKC